ncbi:alpha/beta hydrolase, partial [bacterium]
MAAADRLFPGGHPHEHGKLLAAGAAAIFKDGHGSDWDGKGFGERRRIDQREFPYSLVRRRTVREADLSLRQCRRGYPASVHDDRGTVRRSTLGWVSLRPPVPRLYSTPMPQSTTMLAAALALSFQISDARVSSVVGDLRIERKFVSKILGNERDLRVWLPPGYEKEPRRRFPVTYLHDGQNVFDGMTSFIPNQEWRADETVKALSDAGLLPPMILVGIDNAGAARGDEYLPTRKEYGGKADLYGRFLLEEVMPFVDKTYRTKKGPRETALVGSSFGGVITAYLGLRHPE